MLIIVISDSALSFCYGLNNSFIIVVRMVSEIHKLVHIANKLFPLEVVQSYIWILEHPFNHVAFTFLDLRPMSIVMEHPELKYRIWRKIDV